MEKKEIDELKKLISTTQQPRKPIKDLRTSILQDLSDGSETDTKKELFNKAKLLLKIRSKLMENKANLEKTDDKTIIDKIDGILGTSLIKAGPTFSGDKKIYTFKDGSEADEHTYAELLKDFNEHAMLDRIFQIEIAISDGLAEIMKKEKQLWEKDDGIEEIIVGDENNGGSRTGTS